MDMSSLENLSLKPGLEPVFSQLTSTYTAGTLPVSHSAWVQHTGDESEISEPEDKSELDSND